VGLGRFLKNLEGSYDSLVAQVNFGTLQFHFLQGENTFQYDKLYVAATSTSMTNLGGSLKNCESRVAQLRLCHHK
jgi:hypothetical protein